MGWTADGIKRPAIWKVGVVASGGDDQTVCWYMRLRLYMRDTISLVFRSGCLVCAVFGSWDIVYDCKMRIEQNRKITVCMCVFVRLFLCVFVFSGSLTTGPDVEFSPSVSVLFACSPFVSNHSFTLAVNKRVGKSICTRTCTTLSLCSRLDAAFLKPPTLIWSEGKRKHLRPRTHTRIRADHTLALLLTRDWAKTHTPTVRNHRESAARSHSFPLQLSANRNSKTLQIPWTLM